MNVRASDLEIGLDELNCADCLIYGIGNTARQDDGLGSAFIDWLEEASLCPRAELRRHYQLHLEDADLISAKSHVLFVDATKDRTVETFDLRRVEPRLDFSFTSHAISAPAVLATCERCFEQAPITYLLAIRGYEWELKEGLTPSARRNLDKAMAFVQMRRSEGSTRPSSS